MLKRIGTCAQGDELIRDTAGMNRRNFVILSSSAMVASALGKSLPAHQSGPIDAAWYRHSRHFAPLSMSRVAYVERGHGPAALFVHGYPLNGFQWRGALDKLHKYRRCIAPDVMGMGFTETPKGQAISPETQATMLASLLDFLRIDTVDLVANDSGGMVSQLFLAKYPHRVRTLLLTNCDVDENNPPPQFLPFIELAKKGLLVDRFIVPQLIDKQLARSEKGMGGLAYTYPSQLADETIEAYFRPLVESPLRKCQFEQYAISMEANCLVAIRENLRQWKGSAKIVWGMKDALFGIQSAEWLNSTLPGSRGIRRVEGANLFFPEEMPEIIAEEAKTLWNIA